MEQLFVIQRTAPAYNSEPKYIAAAVTHNGAMTIMKDIGYDNNYDYEIVPVSVPFYGKYLRYAYMYSGYRINGDGETVDEFIVSDIKHTMYEAERTPIWGIVQKTIRDNPGVYCKTRKGQIVPYFCIPPFPTSEQKIVAGIDKVRIYKI